VAAETELTQVLLAAAQRLAGSVDPEDGLIRCEYAWVEGARIDESTLPPLPLNREGGGMQSRVIVTGEPLLVNDVAERFSSPVGRTTTSAVRAGSRRSRRSAAALIDSSSCKRTLVRGQTRGAWSSAAGA